MVQSPSGPSNQVLTGPHTPEGLALAHLPLFPSCEEEGALGSGDMPNQSSHPLLDQPLGSPGFPAPKALSPCLSVFSCCERNHLRHAVCNNHHVAITASRGPGTAGVRAEGLPEVSPDVPSDGSWGWSCLGRSDCRSAQPGYAPLWGCASPLCGKQTKHKREAKEKAESP